MIFNTYFLSTARMVRESASVLPDTYTARLVMCCRLVGLRMGTLTAKPRYFVMFVQTLIELNISYSWLIQANCSATLSVLRFCSHLYSKYRHESSSRCFETHVHAVMLPMAVLCFFDCCMGRIVLQEGVIK